MYQFVLIMHILAALCLIGLVLVQQGKGATMGAAFGSGASQTVFGSRGSGSFLLKLTIGFIVLFFATSLILNNMASRGMKQSNQVALPMELPAVPQAQPRATEPLLTPDSIPGLPPVSQPVSLPAGNNNG